MGAQRLERLGVGSFFEEMALAKPSMASERDLNVVERVVPRDNRLKVYAPKSMGMSLHLLCTSVDDFDERGIVLRCSVCVSGSCMWRGYKSSTLSWQLWADQRGVPAAVRAQGGLAAEKRVVPRRF